MNQKPNPTSGVGISRRTLLGATAAGVGVGSFAGLSLAQVEKTVEKLKAQGWEAHPTACCMCGARCGLLAMKKKGAKPGPDSVRIFPNPSHPQRGYCGRGAQTLWLWNHPLRIRKPLKRKGERGSGEFEEISWDQALNEIAAKLKEITEKYGEKSVMLTSHNFTGYQAWFAQPFGTPNVINHSATCNSAPVETIVRLARLFATTKPVFFAQGYGSQRQANGEQTVRAIAMLPILTGQVGLPGTNHGGREGDISLKEAGLPAGKNPVKTSISFFTWVDAIDHGDQMTAVKDGVRGRDKLEHPIKFLWNQCSNVMVNQHSDHNGTAKILADESKCEFILVIDNQMTSSAKFADILLPDVMQQELNDIAADGYATGTSNFMVALQKAVEPQWEQRSGYAICTALAERFGIKEKYTEGRTQEEWVEWCYNETRKKHPAMPDFKTFWKQGIVKVPGLGVGKTVVLKDFREDPAKHPLKTPSGKIEIWSGALDKLAKTWTLDKDEVISALPMYVRTFEMPGDPLQQKYPLQCFGYHGHGRTHSTYHNVPWLREVQPD